MALPRGRIALASAAGVALFASGCRRAATDVIVETPPDVAAVRGTVVARSGTAVSGAAINIEAILKSGAGAATVESLFAQTDARGRFLHTFVFGPLGLRECLLRITVSPPAGAALAPAVDSVTAAVNAGWPPADTAILDFTLSP